MIGIGVAVGISRLRGIGQDLAAAIRAALFGSGEKGVFYDPSDLTAEKIAFRRNLLTYTEDFGNAVWTKSSVTVTSNAAIAPDGTITATKLVENAGVSRGLVGQLAPSANKTVSVYAKAAEWGHITLGISNIGGEWSVVNFDLVNGTIGATTSYSIPLVDTPTIVSVGNGWYRCSVRVANSATTTVYTMMPFNQSGDPVNPVPALNGDGVSGIYIWHPQIETGSTATTYQKITNFNTEFMAAFPSHALYQDSVGTTPVTTVGQPVGMLLDKSKGLIATSLGSVTGWENNGYSTFTPSGASVALISAGYAAAGTLPLLSITTGKLYKVVIDVTHTSGTLNLYIGTLGSTYSTKPSFNSSGRKTAYLLATGTSALYRLCVEAATALNTTVTVVSMEEVAGNHATQATSTARPILARHPITGKRNMLTYTEDFGNGAWTKIGATATSNRIAESATTNQHAVAETPATLAATNYTITADLKADTRTIGYVHLGTSGATAGARLVVDLTTGNILSSSVIAGVYTLAASSVTDLGGGTYRLSLTASCSSASATYPYVGCQESASTASYLGDITKGIYAGRVQFELGSTPTDYQKVVSTYDVTEAGVADAYHLVFDGVDDFMATPSIDFSATDKMSVFAGVQKLSDALEGVYAETSTDAAGANPGAFRLTAPIGSAAATYGALLRGATSVSQGTYSGHAAPNTKVITTQMNILQAGFSNAVSLRMNSSLQSAAVNANGDAGSNFGNYPLYVGSRNGVSRFNGNLYSLIVRGALSDAAQIAAAESYVNSKTGAY